MGHLNVFRIASTGLVATVLLMAIGCTATSRVAFNGPPGTVLFIDDEPYHLPTTVEFTRPAGSTGSTRHSAGLAYTLNGQDVKAAGYLDAFAYTESSIDEISTATCKFDAAQLALIPDGKTLVYKGQTASRQPCYELTLKLK